QRRHQKIIEEAPAISLSDGLRQKIIQAARQLIAHTDYRSAATVEFLVQDDAFYLLEVNTRLQVEHPVTEMVMGVDLVKAQLLTALESFRFSQEQIHRPRGHAIECRIYAENPYLGGIPSTGELGFVEWPYGPHRRFDYGFEAGDEISSYYDPMIAKIIVWDMSRPLAIKKMYSCLSECIILGVFTNIPFLRKILCHEEFFNDRHTTQFISQYFSNPLAAEQFSPEEEALLKKEMDKILKSQIGNKKEENISAFSREWRM
ncbi:MAG: acetyl-CoA carboxylase biotin carboxylase subunit, partial [Bdellovibrionaceae bacterium]|nr:acetyl-CoA carboxylase biotin carboxylase subunit [Pseudobdellovibrionaceae bacterium]MDW8191010.1 acetyl-CoA carboxylase biotin carboxylase subunit [Pseudobdellovibrionaceae bacterium]